MLPLHGRSCLPQNKRICRAHALHAHAMGTAPASPEVHDAGVDREIRSHVPEPFWYIHVSYRAPEGQACAFTWARGHIYDHAVATMLYETCVDEPLATVIRASHLMGCRLCMGSLLCGGSLMRVAQVAGMLQSCLRWALLVRAAPCTRQAHQGVTGHARCEAWAAQPLEVEQCAVDVRNFVLGWRAACECCPGDNQSAHACITCACKQGGAERGGNYGHGHSK